MTRQESTRTNVPDRPMPAEQCTTAGPALSSRLPLSRTAPRNSRKVSGVGWRFDRLSKSPIYDPKTGFPVVTVLTGQPVPKL